MYGNITKRVMDKMDKSGMEDLGLIARLMYGYILSNTDVLTAAETSFVGCRNNTSRYIVSSIMRFRVRTLLGKPTTEGPFEGKLQVYDPEMYIHM